MAFNEILSKAMKKRSNRRRYSKHTCRCPNTTSRWRHSEDSWSKPRREKKSKVEKCLRMNGI